MAAKKSKTRFTLPDISRPVNRRPSRVADTIRKELAMLLIQKTKDPRLYHISITDVDVSPDLKNAKVYFGCNEDEVKDVQAGLESAKGFMRSHLAQVMSLRHIPKLNFIYDQSIEKRKELERLFMEIENERTQ